VPYYLSRKETVAIEKSERRRVRIAYTSLLTPVVALKMPSWVTGFLGTTGKNLTFLAPYLAVVQQTRLLGNCTEPPETQKLRTSTALKGLPKTSVRRDRRARI